MSKKKENKSKSRQEGIAALEERFLDVATRIGNVVNSLPTTMFGRHIAGQIVRSGTSPAPNYGEACGAESPRDFAHKLGICLKELRETRVWLALIMRAKLIEKRRIEPLYDEVDQLTRIIGKSLVTARRNMKRKPKRRPKS